MKTLRCGGVCILTDADSDGAGYILNFSDRFWPALLRSKNILMRFVTPMMKLQHKRNRNDVRGFFTKQQFDLFAEQADVSAYHVQHLQGLGTSERVETLRYFMPMEEKGLKFFDMSPGASKTLNDIFNPKTSAWRKKWLLASNNEEANVDYLSPRIDMNLYFNTEMREHSRYAMVRATANVVDGMKPSQRRILFCALRNFGSNNTEILKVAQLGPLAASQTNYAHGEDGLNEAIIRMAQDFPGFNDMPLFRPTVLSDQG